LPAACPPLRALPRSGDAAQKDTCKWKEIQTPGGSGVAQHLFQVQVKVRFGWW